MGQRGVGWGGEGGSIQHWQDGQGSWEAVRNSRDPPASVLSLMEKGGVYCQCHLLQSAAHFGPLGQLLSSRWRVMTGRRPSNRETPVSHPLTLSHLQGVAEGEDVLEVVSSQRPETKQRKPFPRVTNSMQLSAYDARGKSSGF